MPNLIEDRLASLLAGWIDTNRPERFPSDLPVHVANRDELRARPCVVLNASESKPVQALPHTARVKLDVHLFSQVDDTPAETHAAWAGMLVSLLQGKAAIRAALNSDTFTPVAGNGAELFPTLGENEDGEFVVRVARFAARDE